MVTIDSDMSTCAFIIFLFYFLKISLILEHGIGISLINSVPEELLFASLTGIRVSFLLHVCSSPLGLHVQVYLIVHLLCVHYRLTLLATQ